MKFTKTALAVAIAGMAAAPMAQADVTLSGQVAVFLGASDLDNEDELTLVGDDSTINVTATHETNNGLTGYGTVRFDGALTDSTPATDGTRVGIKGGFGDIRLGDTFNPIKYGQFNDIMVDIGDSAYFDDVEEQAIGYEGSFGPATIGVMFSPEGNRDTVGAGIKLGFGGFFVGVGAGTAGPGPNSTDPDQDLMSAGASYSIGGAKVYVSFKDFDGVEAVSAGASYGVGAVSGTLTFETLSSDDAPVDGDSKIRLDLGYGLGGGMDLSTRINIFTDDTDGAANEDETDWRVMLTKTF